MGINAGRAPEPITAENFPVRMLELGPNEVWNRLASQYAAERCRAVQEAREETWARAGVWQRVAGRVAWQLVAVAALAAAMVFVPMVRDAFRNADRASRAEVAACARGDVTRCMEAFNDASEDSRKDLLYKVYEQATGRPLPRP